MPRKAFTPQLSWSGVEVSVPAKPPAAAKDENPVTPIPHDRVTGTVATLHKHLGPGGKWADKTSEWKVKLLLYTIDCLAATIMQYAP